jgi:hypothetical protein
MPATACTRATTSWPSSSMFLSFGADDHVVGAGDGLGLLNARDIDDVLGDLCGLADLGLDKDVMPSPSVPTSLLMPPAAPEETGAERDGGMRRRGCRSHKRTSEVVRIGVCDLFAHSYVLPSVGGDLVDAGD